MKALLCPALRVFPVAPRRSALCRAEKSKSAPLVDYYDILQVDFDATVGEIKFNYRKLQKQYHPDIAGENDMSSVLNTAYQTLVDPGLRALYDRQLSSVPLSRRPFGRGFRDQPGIVGPLSDAELVLKEDLKSPPPSSKETSKERVVEWLREWAKTFLFASDYPIPLSIQCDDIDDGVRLAFITTSRNRIRSAGELSFVVQDDETEGRMKTSSLSVAVYRMTMMKGILPGEFQVMKAFKNALKDKRNGDGKQRKFVGVELQGLAATLAAEFMPVFVGLPIEKVQGSSYSAYHLKRPDPDVAK